MSRYESLKQVEKQLGRPPIELQEAPQMPEHCVHIWHVLSRVSCVSFQELKAFSELTGDTLSTWEIDAIIALDHIRQNPSQP